MALTAADKAWISADNDRAAAVAAQKVWGTMLTRPDGPDASGNKQTSAGAYQSYNDVINKNTAEAAADRVIATLKPAAKA